MNIFWFTIKKEHERAAYGKNKMAKFELYVSDKKESLDYHIEKLYRDQSVQGFDTKIIVPGTRPAKTDYTKINTALVKNYLQEFTQKSLQEFSSSNLIIENTHHLSWKSIEQLIRFSKNNLCSVYMFSKIHNLSNCKYEVLDDLADVGIKPIQLEDFAVDKKIPTVTKASQSEKLPRKEMSDTQIEHLIKEAWHLDESTEEKLFRLKHGLIRSLEMLLEERQRARGK